MQKLQEKKDLATQIRRDVLRMIHAVNSGHPGGSLGCVELFVALYTEILEYRLPFTMDGQGEDLFFLSNGHISPVYYSILARNGFFSINELSTFRKLNSRLQGHPTTHNDLPGIRIASGSLGQGLSVAIGAALSKKLNKETQLIFSLHGDGELQEGQLWEGFMFAAHHRVDNIITIIDYNGRQIDGDTKDIMSLGDLNAKLNSFGWKVLEEKQGNDLEKVINLLNLAKSKTQNGSPIAIILHTEMGFGVDYMMKTHTWHGKAPNNEQLKKALLQLPETLGDY